MSRPICETHECPMIYVDEYDYRGWSCPRCDEESEENARLDDEDEGREEVGR